MTVHLGTIIARNYLPFARVLARSFRAQHPDGHVSVLVIDDHTKSIDDAKEPFDVVRLEDLRENPADLHRMALYYDLTELATAVKPWLLEHILASGAPEALYLDPDIAVYAPLDEVATLARQHGIVLTPHATAPIPRDGRMVDETSILAAGIYNLGFIAVAQTSGPFLEFWKERLRRECIIAPERMRFVDQRWIDFVPGMFDVAILRDTAYNVAYWNLHHRRVGFANGRWEVDGRPLRCFHFSGYRPDAPHLLSKHQGDRPRILLSEHPELLTLSEQYGAELLQAGYGADDRVAYGIDRLANGIPIDNVIRSYYRDWLSTATPEEDPPPDPFDDAGANELLRRLNEIAVSVQGPSRLSRYHATRYSLDAGLRARFADPQGADYPAFLEWTRAECAAGRLDARLVQSPVAGESPEPSTAAPRPPRLPPAGIRVAGYLKAEMGVGQLGRLAATVVEAAGIDTTHHVDGRTLSRQEDAFATRPDAKRSVNLVCVNADELPGFAARVGPAFFESTYTIGLWAWEVPTFPTRFTGAFSYVDEIWGCSTFTRDAIASATSKPTFAFPPPIVVPDAPGDFDWHAHGIPPGRHFLFCFDLASVMERKNPIGLIEAFSRAFSPGEGPDLVIKTMSGARSVADLERLRLAAAGRPDIHLLDAELSYAENAALINACDCYVSLHRSEGFGLTMAEAMAYGKPVIATAYSGNLDFMGEDTAYLVPWTPGEVPPGCDPYPVGSPWAEPDLGAAAAAMRSVFEQPAEAAARGRRAQQAVHAAHSVQARTAFVLERFAAAQDIVRARRRRRALWRLVPRPLRAAAARARRPIGAPAPSAGAGSSQPTPAGASAPSSDGIDAVWSDAVVQRLSSGTPNESAAPSARR